MSARDEVPVHGLHAALAVAAHRPHAIKRVLYTRAARPHLGPLLKATAAARRPYREVEDADLEKVAKTIHHEGVVVVAEPLAPRRLSQLMETLPKDAVLVALDHVGNPHNLGAILRTAAWFGAAAVIYPDDEKQAGVSPAAMRVARGGAEVVHSCPVPELPEALRRLHAAGVHLLGADQRATHSLFTTERRPGPICLVFGSETEGLSKEVRQICRARFTIPGTGKVESLNVSVAVAIALAELTRPRARG